MEPWFENTATVPAVETVLWLHYLKSDWFLLFVYEQCGVIWFVRNYFYTCTHKGLRVPQYKKKGKNLISDYPILN